MNIDGDSKLWNMGYRLSELRLRIGAILCARNEAKNLPSESDFIPFDYRFIGCILLREH